MLNTTRIDHINLRVTNLRRSIDFYHDLFGYEIKETGTDDRNQPWAIVGKPDCVYLCLYQHPEKSITDDALTLDHFGLVVVNFSDALEVLEQNRVEVLYGGPVQWPHSKSIYIKDPSGHVIELTERVGGGLDLRGSM